MTYTDLIDLVGLGEFKRQIVNLINNHVTDLGKCWVYLGDEDYSASDSFDDITINNNKHENVKSTTVINLTKSDEDNCYLYIIYPIASEIIPKLSDSNIGIKGTFLKNVTVDTAQYSVWKSKDAFTEGFKLRIL